MSVVVWESVSGGGMGISLWDGMGISLWGWYGDQSVGMVWESVSGGNVKMGVQGWSGSGTSG